MDTLPLGVMMGCSGVLPVEEWRENPITESEHGEWAGSILYSVVFTAAFFVGVYSFLGRFFS